MADKSLKAADLWSGLALAALGVYIIVEARQWEFMGPDGPGPGFFPLWYGIVMVVLSVALVVSSVLRKASSADHAVNWREARRVAATWLALVASVATLKLLGFAISFALLTFFVITVMYRRPPMVAALIAIASSAGFYLLFPLALGVALPTGVLGF
jgi:putative tricarboxylic transport membrane protein